MRVRLANCFVNRCTSAISHSYEVARDANAARECGVVVRSSPKFSWTLSFARRDRVAVHALSCGCDNAQRDAHRRADVLRGPSQRAVNFWSLGGRAVCLSMLKRWLATLTSSTFRRAVPAVRRHTELAHSNARLLATWSQVLLSTC